VTDEPDAIDEPTYEALVEMVGGDREFIDDLIDTFLADAVEQLADLDAAVAAGDASALTRPAHSMKSSSLNVGALELGRLGRELEAQGREGQIAGAAERVAEAHRQFESVRTSLLARRAEDATA
jgi:HPt (histidine-containing phosphotransfer) domain-containing protein